MTKQGRIGLITILLVPILIVAAVALWFVWPRAQRPADPRGLRDLPLPRRQNPFGIHGIGLPYFPQLGVLGCSKVRIIISTPVWDRLERDGQLDLQPMDDAVATVQRYGVDIVLTIMPNSRRWGAQHLFVPTEGRLDPTVHADTPRDFAAYARDLEAIVRRYNGDGHGDMPGLRYPIDTYQLVNEWVWQWRGSKESYLTFLEQSARIIRAAHPGARIVLGGLTGVELWAQAEGFDDGGTVNLGGMTGRNEPLVVPLEEFDQRAPGLRERTIGRLRFIMEQGLEHVDVIDVHSYTERASEMIPSLRLLRAKAPDSELWSLETGGPFHRYTPQRHTDEVIMRHVVGLAHGLRKIFWSSYNPTAGWSRNFLNLSLVNDYGGAKPAHTVYRFLTSVLDGAVEVVELESPAGVQAYRIAVSSAASVASVGGEKGPEVLYVVAASAEDGGGGGDAGGGGGAVVSLPFPGHDEVSRLSFRVGLLQRLHRDEERLPVIDGEVRLRPTGTPSFVGVNLPQRDG